MRRDSLCNARRNAWQPISGQKCRLVDTTSRRGLFLSFSRFTSKRRSLQFVSRPTILRVCLPYLISSLANCSINPGARRRDIKSSRSFTLDSFIPNGIRARGVDTVASVVYKRALQFFRDCETKQRRIPGAARIEFHRSSSVCSTAECGGTAGRFPATSTGRRRGEKFRYLAPRSGSRSCGVEEKQPLLASSLGIISFHGLASSRR